MPVHIHPTAALAPRALLPGDPGRALMLAQLLLEQPRMFNHNRGLWGYTGAAADGAPLTIQSTGMGGPSAAIVMEELCDLGLQTAVRVGTCGALDTGLRFGDVVVVDAALATDGTSRALGAGERVAADAGLVAALHAAAGDGARVGAVASSDVFYERDGGRAAGWTGAGALAVEMEAATLLRVAELRGVRAGCVLAVSDVFVDGERRRIDADALVSAAERIGAVAAAALGAS
jgi:DeoD family purine-nucleoside phosphorylase